MGDSVDELISTARAAYARGDWSAANQGLTLAREHGELPTDGLDLLGSTLWWLGNVGESLAMSEEVYQRYEDQGDHLLAVRKALDLALLWFIRGDIVIASGWCNRARRLLESAQDSPESGYLLYLDAAVALDYDNLAPTREAARQLQAMGMRFHTPPLTSLSLVLSGLADIREGKTSSGFAQLDEAMLPVVSGHMPAEWSGDIYCTVIHACYELADTPRMRAWTDAMEQWCRQFQGEVVYSGICRIHRLQLLCLEGEWEHAEESMSRSGNELVGRNNWVAGEAFYQLGEIQRLRGNSAGAREAFDRARSLGAEPQPGEALLQLAGGEPEKAWAGLCSMIAGLDRLSSARLLGPAVEVAVHLNRLEAAEHWCEDLETTAMTFATTGFRAWAAHARARVLLAQGRHSEALPKLRAAAADYRSLHARHDAAMVHELLSQAHLGLGDHAAAAADRAQALAIYRSLGAAPDVRRLDVQGLPGGLTEREAAVLSLIASGASNRDIADRLYISQKTVGRHLSNIYTKIGVTSRTAAAAWAHRNGVGNTR